MSADQEKNKMSILEKNLTAHLEKIKRIARANTVKNNEGLTVVTKDDPFREDPDWEASKKQSGNQKK